VSRAHDADIDRDFHSSSDALDHALLQEAQELRLQSTRQVPISSSISVPPLAVSILPKVCLAPPVNAPFS